jgi:hypothetical protein
MGGLEGRDRDQVQFVPAGWLGERNSFVRAISPYAIVSSEEA